MSFDMINFDSEDSMTGSFYLDAVTLEPLSEEIFTTPTFVQDYAFTTSTQGWTSFTYPAIFNAPSFLYTSQALTITCTTNTELFGFWQSLAEISVVSNALYRIQATVSSDQADAVQVPQIRLRVNLQNEWAAQVMVVESLGTAANSPAAPGSKTYAYYFTPPPEAVGGMMYLSFDIINFLGDDAPDATCALEMVTIERFDLP